MSSNGSEPLGARPGQHPVAGDQVVVHVILIGQTAGEPTVLLLEREPRLVEFPTLVLSQDGMADEAFIAARIAGETGLEVAIEGYLGEPPGVMMSPPGSRFLLARALSGRPQISAAHIGWEWRPAANLLALQFIPKLMADELRSFMDP